MINDQMIIDPKRELIYGFCEHIQRGFFEQGRMDWASSPFSFIEYMNQVQPENDIPWFREEHGIRVTYSELYTAIDREASA